MPLPLTVSRSSKIQIGFTFLVPAYPGCPGKEAVKWLLLLLLTCDKTQTDRHKATAYIHRVSVTKDEERVLRGG